MVCNIISGGRGYGLATNKLGFPVFGHGFVFENQNVRSILTKVFHGSTFTKSFLREPGIFPLQVGHAEH